MAHDFKRLCNELLSYLYQCNWPDGKRFYALTERTRAALAEPEPKMVTKAELDKFVEEYWGSMKGFYPGGNETIYTPFELIAREHFTNFASDVLARWGNYPGSPDCSGNLKAGLTRSPAAGEVAELVAWLRATAETLHEGNIQTPRLTRAAGLLERLSPPRLAAEPPPPKQGQAFKDADTGVIYVRDGDQWLATQPVPQPVPVSERLPLPGDCDEEGRCWWWYPEVPDKTYGYWAYEDDAVPERALNEQPTHWLPAHALPLPS